MRWLRGTNCVQNVATGFELRARLGCGVQIACEMQVRGVNYVRGTAVGREPRARQTTGCEYGARPELLARHCYGSRIACAAQLWGANFVGRKVEEYEPSARHCYRARTECGTWLQGMNRVLHLARGANTVRLGRGPCTKWARTLCETRQRGVDAVASSGCRTPALYSIGARLHSLGIDYILPRLQLPH